MRTVNFYKDASGHMPVEEFLDGLSAEQAKKMVWVLQLIEKLPTLPSQYFKKLTNTDDIWEVRAISSGNIFRILGFFNGSTNFIATNGFQKKTQKTPQKEIKRAEKSKLDYEKRNIP